eukprot:TRINITY_DN48724_c0_g1_i1.p1 TRINITY_DN48724_c0_g1~~TRINITY_DN48724_c0_g1_i1.p1  ORF type:complete len:393 (+),score=24.43 TRINITY_DN48724_c0_g1_i1:68-1180(+)
MAQTVLKCIYNFPIFGGFCAPTQSFDTSWFRHVSNEYTLPGAPRFMIAAPLCEYSPCCLFCGQLGTNFGRSMRKQIMMFAFAMNVIALIFTIVAAVGLTTDPATLRNVAWVIGNGKMLNNANVEVNIGLAMRSDYLYCNSNGVVNVTQCELFARQSGHVVESGRAQRSVLWSDENACAIKVSADADHSCGVCKRTILPKSTLILSLVTQIPTITTDLQRTTTFGDVNCQKTMGMLTNIFSLFSSLLTLLAFRQACYSQLPTRMVGVANLQWSLGPGFRLIMGATVIKLIDCVCHFCVPTPVGRKTKPKEKTLTLVDYLRLARPYEDNDLNKVQDAADFSAQGADVEAPFQAQSAESADAPFGEQAETSPA